MEKIKEEIWKDIEEYENLYQVSSIGRVKSLNYNHTTGKDRILKPAKDIYGYLYVSLCKQGKIKTHRIHRLVAEAFIPNPNNFPQVNHKNEDKTNNYVSNLEWCDRKYNCNYGTRNKRIAEKCSKQVLCVETGKIYPSTHQVEKQLGFAHQNIVNACIGKRKTCGGFHWKYV